MNDPTLNQVLQWGIKNSGASRSDPSAPPPKPLTDTEREALSQFFTKDRGPSDAQRMVACMEVQRDEKSTLDEKKHAFRLFEEIISNLDNANNIEALAIKYSEGDQVKSVGLWTVLISQLEHENAKVRKRAARCCGTAVQNNIRTQERFLILGAIPTLVRMATTDPAPKARKAAITALSSEVRNNQPGLDIAMTHVPADLKPQEKIDAADMDSVNILISKLRANIPKSAP